MKKSLKKGFTLIELLVVIAIIGILATIVIVNVAGARTKATKTKVAADMSSAANIYNACSSFGGTPLKFTVSGGSVCTTTNITDPVELTNSTGNWPTLPNTNFTITAAAALGTNIGEVTANASAGGGVYTCKPTGCSGNSAW